MTVLQAEMKLAMQQSQDLARARKCIEAMLGGEAAKPLEKEAKRSSEKARPSPIKAKTDLKAHFSEPPAPPPQAPLPEKPDVARALADPLIQPLLRRADTTKPGSASSSPTRMDHSSDILRLCEELKSAKGELTSQAERMKGLESQLAQERNARASAEERAMRVAEGSDKEDSQDAEKDDEGTKQDFPNSATASRGMAAPSSAADLEAQLERLQATMDEMKQQMEAYRQRAESAESERDEARQSLAEMVEQKRKEASRSRSRSRRRRVSAETTTQKGEEKDTAQNGAPPSPSSLSTPTTTSTLLQRAGLTLDSSQAITPEQARMIQSLLSREVLGCSPEATDASGEKALATNNGLVTSKEGTLMYHGRPLTGAAFVVVLGVCLMGWMNSWPKMER